MQLPLGHDPVLCKKGGYGEYYRDEIIKSNINEESSVDNKCVNVCINDNVKTVNFHSQVKIQVNNKVGDSVAQKKYGHNVDCNQMLKVNSEGTSQSGCQADVLCPTGDCKCLCIVRDSSLGAASGLIANFKNNIYNTNSTSSNVADPNGIVGPRVIPVTIHNNAIVMPQNYSDTFVEQYRFDFTNWHFVQNNTGNTMCIVYIPHLQNHGS